MEVVPAPACCIRAPHVTRNKRSLLPCEAGLDNRHARNAESWYLPPNRTWFHSPASRKSNSAPPLNTPVGHFPGVPRSAGCNPPRDRNSQTDSTGVDDAHVYYCES